MKTYLLYIYISFVSFSMYAQDSVLTESKPIIKEPRELKYNFNEDGSHYLKFTFTNQIWIRYNESNPGSTINGKSKSETFDIGLRRTRMQLLGQISNRVFVYLQIGQNNLTYNSPRKQGLFIHDATSEYIVVKDYISLGAGLSGWSGLSRYASPSASSILSLDAPIYLQATNDATDQFLRKYSVYAKGKLNKFDYRMALSVPMILQNSSIQNTTIGKNSTFSSESYSLQYQGYFMYQFFEKELNLVPYTVGNYLGKKRVFNIGGGFITQANAMWRLADNGIDTLKSDMNLFAVDLFYDAPINKEKRNSITVYACLSSYDFGKNNLRYTGIMNPVAPAINANTAAYTGGNAFPMVGTGNTLYAQIGYLFRKDLLGEHGTLQPFACVQYSDYKILKDPMLMIEGGLNWLIEGRRSKLSLMYQNRPVYMINTAGEYKVSSRNGMAVLQFQIAI